MGDMKYSPEQLNLVRDALHAYKAYGRSELDGKDYSWASIAEAIAEYTGVTVPSERLRQFIEGVSTPAATRKFPVPKPARLEAIVKFVTHEELELLSAEELETQRPNFQAPYKLLDYLDSEKGAQRLLPTAEMEGEYMLKISAADNFIVSIITLEPPLEGGLIEAFVRDHICSPEAAPLWDDMSPQQRLDACNSTVRYQGWVIVTPEDNLFFFLKRRRDGRNRYYFSMASDPALWSDDDVTFLTLLEHEFPYELDASDNDPDAIHGKSYRALGSKLHVYRRTVQSSKHFEKVRKARQEQQHG